MFHLSFGESYLVRSHSVTVRLGSVGFCRSPSEKASEAPSDSPLLLTVHLTTRLSLFLESFVIVVVALSPLWFCGFA